MYTGIWKYDLNFVGPFRTKWALILVRTPPPPQKQNSSYATAQVSLGRGNQHY